MVQKWEVMLVNHVRVYLWIFQISYAGGLLIVHGQNAEDDTGNMEG